MNQNVANDESGPIVFGAKRPLKSDVWPYFTQFLDRNGVMKAKCKYWVLGVILAMVLCI